MIPIKIIKNNFFFVHSINMSNINQNNEVESLNKEISLLQDRLKINEKSLNQFKNGLRRIGRLRLKQGQKTNLSGTKKVQKVFKDISKNKIKNIEKKDDLLKDSEEITLLYKSEYNLERENKVLLLMINDDDNEKYHYFGVKSKSELYSSEWLRSEKESITNEDNCFQNALND